MEKRRELGRYVFQIVFIAVIIFTLIFFGQQGNAATSPSSSLQSQTSDEPIFMDVPIDHWARSYIEELYLAGYISGCSSEPLLYCPDEMIKRCESAVFIERGIHGEAYLPPQYGDEIFADVLIDEWYHKWVNGLWNDGYTAGCGVNPLIFCPLQLHTISEGTVFFLRMLNGPDYFPPDPIGIFDDVSLDLWYARWVEAAYDAGILLPCQETPSLKACPEDPLYRDMAAYMMYQAIGIGDVDPTPTPSPLPPTPTPTPVPPTAIPSGNVYYVSVNGNDNNAGTSQSQPWRTIQKALNQVEEGDTIRIMGGTYSESLRLRRSGTSSEPIAMLKDSNDPVVIDGGSNPALLNEGNIQYWTIQGLTFRSNNRYTIRLGWWGSSETAHIIMRDNLVYGSVFTIGSYHLFEGNEVDGTGYTGSYGDAGLSDASTSHHITYRDNYVHDFTHNNGRGIWTQGNTHDHLIEGNRIINISGSGLGQCIDLDGASNVEWRHVVRDNYSENCSYVGIQLENVFDSLIENNTINNVGSAGIIVINYDSNVGCGTGGESNQYGDQDGDRNCKGDPTDNKIVGNKINDTSFGAGYGGIVNFGAGAITITDNIIIASNGGGPGINFQSQEYNVRGATLLRNEIDMNDRVAVCVREWSEAVFVVDDYNIFHRANRSSVYGSGGSCGDAYTLQQYQNTYNKAWNSIYIAD